MQGQAGVRGSLIRHIRLPPRPMPPSWAQTIRPYTPRGTHWATCKPELPPNTRLLLAPSVHEAPWSSLKTEFQVRCCSRSIAPAGQRAGGSTCQADEQWPASCGCRWAVQPATEQQGEAHAQIPSCQNL